MAPHPLKQEVITHHPADPLNLTRANSPMDIHNNNPYTFNPHLRRRAEAVQTAVWRVWPVPVSVVVPKKLSVIVCFNDGSEPSVCM